MDNIRYGRKRSGIKKDLRAHIAGWLNCITDSDVKKAARKDVIVTGGSIASMLLGEPINDYDLYFRTKATTQLVAEYYVKEFNTTHGLDGSDALAVRCDSIKNCKGVVEERVTIHAPAEGTGDKEPEEVKTRKNFEPVFISQNAITLNCKTQIIIRFYGSPDDIHDNYDFLHATCYWDHEKQHLELPGAALECLLSRTLKYRGSLYPIASIFRAKKFIERGWRIGAGELLKIMWQISELDLTDYNILKEQLTGVDMAYLWQIIRALKGTAPEKINSAYVIEIIDRVFE